MIELLKSKKELLSKVNQMQEIVRLKDQEKEALQKENDDSKARVSNLLSMKDGSKNDKIKSLERELES
jgi:hypothetical protein